MINGGENEWPQFVHVFWANGLSCGYYGNSTGKLHTAASYFEPFLASSMFGGKVL